MPRGSFKFETQNGTVTDTAANLEALRRLWLDRELVPLADIGPGDDGDFDHGAWHVACHLAGASGVRMSPKGHLLWLTLSHDRTRDLYYASVTLKGATRIETIPLQSADGRKAIAGSRLLGFVEGASTGRISARNCLDAPSRFNLWRRQDFDQPVQSPEDGGKVWEHWCTLRDIRPTSEIGTSVLAGYLCLVSALGDGFAPTVARGRRDYGHPKQLRALVRSGFTREDSALLELSPTRIPELLEPHFLSADESDALTAAGQLDWTDPPRYHMFARKIGSWSRTPEVRKDLKSDPK